MTIETLRGRYRLHRFPPRQRAVTGEPLTASISAADYQRQLMDGFQEGLQKGFAQGMTEGQEQGFSEGHQQGFAEGRRQGYTEGSLAGQQEGRKQFVEAAQPLEAISGKVNDFLAHIERKQREDLLQLVEKVTRQVIRCELALQPTQLLALVEEALAAFPAMPETGWRFPGATATCPTGKRVTGGGGICTSRTGYIWLTRSFPSANNSWSAACDTTEDQNGSITVYAICQ